MNEKTKNIDSMEYLTRGRLLIRNSILNLIGQGTPLLAAFVAIPIIIEKLGTDRFGLLTLAWLAIGYFSIFDLGLGRALTILVAEKLGSGRESQIPAIVWTFLFLMLILGTGVALLIVIFSPWLVYHVLKVPEQLQTETLRSFFVLGICIPVVISTEGLRGVLEAKQRFGLINIARIAIGLITFLSPIFVLHFSSNLVPLVTVLAAGRFLFWIVYLLLCFHTMPLLRRGIKIRQAVVGPMFRLGGWMTVSNFISPFMLYFDRFLIGALISLAAVAYYATPYDVVTKLLIIPGAFTGVLFPAFSASFSTSPRRTALLFGKGFKYILIAIFPIALLIVTFAQPGLGLWLGEEFAMNATSVLRWLAIGILVNSFGQLAFALIQATGRPDLTAKVHIIELPFYLIIVYWMIGRFGIRGAAIAWTLRAMVDAFILVIMGKRLLGEHRPEMQRVETILAIGVLSLLFAMIPMPATIRGAYFLLMILAFSVSTWFLIMDISERRLMLTCLRIRKGD